MADTALPEAVLGEPGERGTLTIRDRVAQKLVIEATRGTPGVRQHAGGMDKLTGRELPRARVLVSGRRVRAKVDIAIEWPGSLSVIGTAVRDNVRAQLESVSGLDVDGVDVSIVSVLPASTNGDAGRKVQ